MTLEYTGRESRIMRAALEAAIYKLEQEIEEVEFRIAEAEIDGKDAGVAETRLARLRDQKRDALRLYKRIKPF